MQGHNYFGPRSLESWGEAKRSNSIKFQLLGVGCKKELPMRLLKYQHIVCDWKIIFFVIYINRYTVLWHLQEIQAAEYQPQMPSFARAFAAYIHNVWK